jgi:hypothetical protein
MKIGAIYATDVSNSLYRAVLPLQELDQAAAAAARQVA